MSYKKSTHAVRETNTAAKLQHFFYSRKYFIKKIRFFVFFLLFALYVLHFLSRHLGSNDCFGRIFAAAFASVLARGVTFVVCAGYYPASNRLFTSGGISICLFMGILFYKQWRHLCRRYFCPILSYRYLFRPISSLAFVYSISNI